ncbi:hypothetical protein PATSB16_16790 [Pandoraea thiooxydans]|nr:hypothetical protein PATSB16_16790 [Pandoraea thiooxydans]
MTCPAIKNFIFFHFLPPSWVADFVGDSAGCAGTTPFASPLACISYFSTDQ